MGNITVGKFLPLIEAEQTNEKLTADSMIYYLGAQIRERYLIEKHFNSIDDQDVKIYYTSVSGASKIDCVLTDKKGIVGAVVEVKVRDEQYKDLIIQKGAMIEIDRFNDLLRIGKKYNVDVFYVTIFESGSAIWNNLNDCNTLLKDYKRMASDTYHSTDIKDKPCYILREYDPLTSKIPFDNTGVFIEQELTKIGFNVPVDFTLSKCHGKKEKRTITD
jgi:hypothetical protein